MDNEQPSPAAVEAFGAVTADLAGAGVMSGMGRPFKDRVRVPAGSAELWPALAEAALSFVGGEA